MKGLWERMNWIQFGRISLLLVMVIGACSLLRAQRPDLMQRRFDQVAFLYTHNSYNVRGHHRLPNQNLTVARQLDLGVRGLMLDVYAHHDRVMLYHANRMLGHRPLQEDLAAIKAFLDAHPQAVMSIIFESHVEADLLARELTQAQLLPYLHTQDPQAPWPTLADMVATGKRLVVFSENDRGNPYPWLLHAWDCMTENRYSNHSRKDFDTHFNRGDSTCQLYLLNHFITHRKFGFGLPDSALVANQMGCLIDHALQVWTATGHFPNFIAVDFVDQGNAGVVVDSLNALWQPTVMRGESLIDTLMIIPKNREIILRFTKPIPEPMTITVRDILTGTEVKREHIAPMGLTETVLPGGPSLPNGDYWIELRVGDHFERYKLHLK